MFRISFYVTVKLHANYTIIWTADQMIRTCSGSECTVMSAGAAKAMDQSLIRSVFPLKGDAELQRALAPSVSTVMASMKGLEAQQSVSGVAESTTVFLFDFHHASAIGVICGNDHHWNNHRNSNHSVLYYMLYYFVCHIARFHINVLSFCQLYYCVHLCRTWTSCTQICRS